MLVAQATQQKGTAFLLSTGHLVTNEHVIRDCPLEKLVGYSAAGKAITFSDVWTDADRDIALLAPQHAHSGGLSVRSEGRLQVGMQVCTWGYPLGYNGPAPLLTVGHVSGFIDYRSAENSQNVTKRLVINGAFNPGNSGGPLFVAGENEVIGVVVSKHAPMTPFVRSAIAVLARNQSGVVFSARDEEGKEKQFVESQVVAEVLDHFRKLTQVVIGEAVAGSELLAFLSHRGIAL
jgi:S1-C subfamily serine protease